MSQILFCFLIVLGIHALAQDCGGFYKGNDFKIIRGNQFVIEASDDVPESLIFKLQSSVERTIRFFTENFGPLSEPVKINVGKGQTLKTGYDHDTGAVSFPPHEKINDFGLASNDVIVHEMFHGLICKSVPALCTKERLTDPDSVRLHEALADYFTFQFEPDLYFGENYYKDQPYMREYRNHRAISLSAGPHAQGNAITAYLIKHSVSLDSIKKFLMEGDFTLEGLGHYSPGLNADLILESRWKLGERISNYPASEMRRYRLVEGKPFIIAFEPNPALLEKYPKLSYSFISEAGGQSLFKVTEISENTFSIEVLPGAKTEKFIMQIRANDAHLGEQSFYFGRALN